MTYKKYHKRTYCKRSNSNKDAIFILPFQNRCFTEFITNKKLASGTKGAILLLIGTLTDHFPNEISKFSAQFSAVLLETLDVQFKSHKPEFPLLTGCMKALKLLFNHFSNLVSSSKKQAWLIQFL